MIGELGSFSDTNPNVIRDRNSSVIVGSRNVSVEAVVSIDANKLSSAVSVLVFCCFEGCGV